MNSNAKQITKRIKNKYNYDIYYVTLSKILLNLRKTIADNLKHIYIINRMGGEPASEFVVTVDECMFVHYIDGN